MTDWSKSRLGRDFEATVESSLAQVPGEVGMFFRDAPLFRPCKFLPGGKVIGFFEGRGGLDFYGAWRGRFLAFDAKSVQEAKRFPLADLKKRDHQVNIVRELHGCGVTAFFLVELDNRSPRSRVFCLTWPVLAPYWASYLRGDKGARASIPVDVLAAQCVEVRHYGAGWLDLTAAFDGLSRKALRDDQAK